MLLFRAHGSSARLHKMESSRKVFAGALIFMLGSSPLLAKEPHVSVNLYGAPGLIDTPSAESKSDADITATISHFAGISRATLSFQITPRLSGSFRYSILRSFPSGTSPDLYDRSYDLQYRLIDEGRYRPAIAIGLQDFGGTGIYASEYIVATKHLHPKLKASAGIGWGRLGSSSSFKNPLSVFHNGFNTRPTNFGQGGKPNANHWFRGPAAFFGGVEWETPVENLTFKAEYSSDAYTQEVGTHNLFKRKSPFNFGLEYRNNRGVTFGAYYLYGSEVGLRITTVLNPKRPRTTGNEEAPIPLRGLAFAPPATSRNAMQKKLKTLLEPEGINPNHLDVTGNKARVYITNKRFGAQAQAIGRTARALSQTLPASVDTIEIIPIEGGLLASSVTIHRADLEELEYAAGGAATLRKRVTLADAPARYGFKSEDHPRFDWSLGVYGKAAIFDPDNPLRFDAGLRAIANWHIAPGFSLNGSVTKKVIGNRGKSTRASTSVLPHVRSDAAIYHRNGDPTLERLTADYVFKLSPDIYGRVSAGYLEEMYGGVSAEVLWKPANSRFGIGAEMNYVKQRDFDQRFGFQNYQIATGHVSAYYAVNRNMHAQLDVGRYLAGDWGATLSLDRTFANGWTVGGYVTLTDVPFSQFGEGSFDKGIRMTIPLSWSIGRPGRKQYDVVLQPLLRDGGARLKVENRLYETIKDSHNTRLSDSWAKFWR